MKGWEETEAGKTTEAAARAEMLKAVEQERINGWHYLKVIADAGPAELEQMGYKGYSQGDAMLKSFKHYQHKMRVLMQIHIRDFPD